MLKIDQFLLIYYIFIINKLSLLYFLKILPIDFSVKKYKCK